MVDYEFVTQYKAPILESVWPFMCLKWIISLTNILVVGFILYASRNLVLYPMRKKLKLAIGILISECHACPHQLNKGFMCNKLFFYSSDFQFDQAYSRFYTNFLLLIFVFNQYYLGYLYKQPSKSH